MRKAESLGTFEKEGRGEKQNDEFAKRLRVLTKEDIAKEAPFAPQFDPCGRGRVEGTKGVYRPREAKRPRGGIVTDLNVL